jgi:hypothetical protein
MDALNIGVKIGQWFALSLLLEVGIEEEMR